MKTKAEFQIDDSGKGRLIINGKEVEHCAGFDLYVRAGEITKLRILHDFVEIGGNADVEIERRQIDRRGVL